MESTPPCSGQRCLPNALDTKWPSLNGQHVAFHILPYGPPSTSSPAHIFWGHCVQHSRIPKNTRHFPFFSPSRFVASSPLAVSQSHLPGHPKDRPGRQKDKARVGGPAEGAAAAGGAGKRRLGGALPRKPGLPSALPVESRAGTEAGGRASLAGQLRGSPTSLSVGFLLWGSKSQNRGAREKRRGRAQGLAALGRRG